jgi:uncharacterized protein (TIGR02118 family)
MRRMLKLIGFLARRAGTSPEAFQAHWRERHAALGRALPGLRRYVQNHTLLSGYRGREPLWDGVVELWFDDLAAFRSAWASSEMAPVREDEPRFLELPRCAAILAGEHVITEGDPPRDGVKLISFLTRRRDLDAPAFSRYWRDRHGPIAARIPGMRRYVQCHTLAETYAGAGRPTYDGVPLAWFDDTDALRASAPSAEYARTREDEANFLEPGTLGFVIAREHEIPLPA